MDSQYPTNALRFESYVVEVDGKIISEYGTLMAALKAGLELRNKFPQSQIKLHDAVEQPRMPVELSH
jgi:hypothetical protein